MSEVMNEPAQTVAPGTEVVPANTAEAAVTSETTDNSGEERTPESTTAAIQEQLPKDLTAKNDGKVPGKEKPKVKPAVTHAPENLVFSMKFEGDDLEFGKALQKVVDYHIAKGYAATKQGVVKNIVAFTLYGLAQTHKFNMPPGLVMPKFTPKK